MHGCTLRLNNDNAAFIDLGDAEHSAAFRGNIAVWDVDDVNDGSDQIIETRVAFSDNLSASDDNIWPDSDSYDTMDNVAFATTGTTFYDETEWVALGQVDGDTFQQVTLDSNYLPDVNQTADTPLGVFEDYYGNIGFNRRNRDRMRRHAQVYPRSCELPRLSSCAAPSVVGRISLRPARFSALRCSMLLGLCGIRCSPLCGQCLGGLCHAGCPAGPHRC